VTALPGGESRQQDNIDGSQNYSAMNEMRPEDNQKPTLNNKFQRTIKILRNDLKRFFKTL